jgi:hypothetical protein
MEADKIIRPIKNRLISRLSKIDLKSLSLGEVYIAGGFLLKSEPKDLDIFPTEKNQFKAIKDNSAKILSETANAKTLELKEGTLVQLCNYWYPNLQKLVDSFDFAHIQIGALVDTAAQPAKIKQIYLSNQFKEAQVSENTFYTGSDYPLSSLLRILKYYERGLFSNSSHIKAAIAVLNDIINLGFRGWEDFKDQLDAVDLGLIPTDLEDCEESLLSLFDNLNKGE